MPSSHDSTLIGPGAANAPAAVPDSLVLAGGCFWCTEAVFRALDGVLDVVPGYAGGTAGTARYDAVCSGRTGHAEAIRIRFDPARITLERLLQVFFEVAHDPTQRDGQGHDRGPQYRSAVFPADDRQHAIAVDAIARLQASGRFAAPIVTTVEPGQTFYPAEPEHHDYAARHPWQPYIARVALPKVAALRERYPDALKPDALKPDATP